MKNFYIRLQSENIINKIAVLYFVSNLVKKPVAPGVIDEVLAGRYLDYNYVGYSNGTGFVHLYSKNFDRYKEFLFDNSASLVEIKKWFNEPEYTVVSLAGSNIDIKVYPDKIVVGQWTISPGTFYQIEKAFKEHKDRHLEQRLGV